MRGKVSPATRVFESPYATTILPAKGAGRAPKGAIAPEASAPAPAPAVAAPEPLAEAPVYIPTHGPVTAPVAAPEPEPVYAPPPAPVFDTPAPVYAPPQPAFAAPAARATEYPVQYPSAPGFPPQPQYASTTHVADPAPFAPVAPSAPASPPAPVGYPSASYQPSYQPPAYQPAAYAPPSTPPSGSQPNRFDPQGYAASGYAAPGYGPPGYLPPAQAQPFQTFPPPGRSTGAKVLIGLAIGVLGFVILGILAAIAIPVFLSQRATPANRNVVLPAMLLEQQKLSSADLDVGANAAVAALQNINGLTETQAAYYGSGGEPVFVVAAGKLPHRPTSDIQQSFFSETAKNNNATLSPTGSGPFGGWMQCGQATTDVGSPVTMCVSLDSAAVVAVVASATSASQLAVVTRQIISSVEQKG